MLPARGAVTEPAIARRRRTADLPPRHLHLGYPSVLLACARTLLPATARGAARWLLPSHCRRRAMDAAAAVRGALESL